MKFRTLACDFQEVKDGQRIKHKKHSVVEIDNLTFAIELLNNQRIDFMLKTAEECRESEKQVVHAVSMSKFTQKTERLQAARGVEELFRRRIEKERARREPRDDAEKYPLRVTALKPFRMQGDKIDKGGKLQMTIEEAAYLVSDGCVTLDNSLEELRSLEQRLTDLARGAGDQEAKRQLAWLQQSIAKRNLAQKKNR